MEKPFWLKLALAILGICLYTGDTIGEVLVGLDLIERCHYFYAASIFSFAIMPGFVWAFSLICILTFFDARDECSLKILLVLLAPLGGALAGIAFIPGGLVMLILLAMAEVPSSERSELVEVKE